MDVYDIAVIGGGINGAAIACDAALRGLSVILIEKQDLAAETSSKSTKLIHGGLRYLEYFQFNFVRKALNERSLLLKIAPHLIKAKAFILPLTKNTRSKTLIRTGLFLYDHLSFKNKLPSSTYISRDKNPEYFTLLDKNIDQAFLFYDAATNDARLTIENALQAEKNGAKILTYHKLLEAKIKDKLWELKIDNCLQKTTDTYKAKVVINATGPWALETAKILDTRLPKTLSFVKGAHLFVPKLYEGEQGYMLQNTDKRIVFVIPYANLTMIGTTEVTIDDLQKENFVSSEEIQYLLNIVNNFFNKKLKPENLIDKYSAIRPLIYEKNTKNTALAREYNISYLKNPAPSIHILGGKITTYRILAKEVIDKLKDFFPNLKPSTTNITPLPGAQSQARNFEEYKKNAYIKYQWLPPKLLELYLNRYGTRTDDLLADSLNIKALGKEILPSLYEKEIQFLCKYEWVVKAEDLIKQRINMVNTKESVEKLASYLNNIYT